MMRRLAWHIVVKHLVALCWYMMPEMDRWAEIKTFMHPTNDVGSEAEF